MRRTIKQQWSLMFQCFANSYPDFFKLVQIAFLIPASTVACERLFSLKNNVKTAARSSLRTQTLDQLVRVNYLSQDVFENLKSRIIAEFLASKDRMIAKYSKETASSMLSK